MKRCLLFLFLMGSISTTAFAGWITLRGSNLEEQGTASNPIVARLAAGSSVGATTLTGLTDVSSATATAGSLLVSNGTTWDSVSTLYVSPNDSGNVGIGTTSPGYKLTVSSTVDNAVSSGSLVVERIAAEGTDRATLYITDARATKFETGSGTSNKLYFRGGGGIYLDSYASQNIVINDDAADVNFRVESDTDANVFVVDGGLNNVGIGTATPTTKLDVNGVVQATGYNLGSTALSLTGLSDIGIATQGAGRLLVSDGTDFQSVATTSSPNNVVCWKSTGELGYCSSVVDINGDCTCN